LIAHRQEAGLSLPEWIKQHRFLKACVVASGEPYVALLLLWEADHGFLYPSSAVDTTGRLSTFTKRLKDAVAVDAELQRWLEWKLIPFSLVPGLPCHMHIRWAVRIDPSAVEPFLGKWKAMSWTKCGNVRRLRALERQLGSPVFLGRPEHPQRGGSESRRALPVFGCLLQRRTRRRAWSASLKPVG